MSKMSAEILRIINTSSEHLTAEDIFLRCKQSGVKCSIASIYRILSALVCRGAICKLSMPGETDRYDKTILPHEHLICGKCHSVADVTISDLKQLLEERVGTKIDSYNLSMHYICPKCRTQGT